MAARGNNSTRLLVLAVLIAAAGWLVHRNILSPAEPRREAATTSPPKRAERSGAAGIRNTKSSLDDLDPTLRLDLLESSRAVRYEGRRRNIFQFYTPPPPPPAPKPAAPPTPVVQAPPAVPPPPPIPLKYYGLAQAPGTSQKKAFLTNGQEIFIAGEGQVVDRFYKIARIGPTNIEVEDTRTQRRQQLPLEE